MFIFVLKYRLMDITKLKEYQNKINVNALKEIYEELPIGIIDFTKSITADQRIENYKSGRKTDQSARVINSWISQGLIEVNNSDKGKIKRFNRLNSIWLNLIIEARKFGVPIEYIKQIQRDLFTSPIKNFSLIRFSILETILRQPKILIILEEGHAKVLSSKIYVDYINRNLLPSHLSFKFLDFIIPEYPKNAFELDFQIEDVYKYPNRVNLLYYLKTGDFESMKIFITDNDVRLIDNPSILYQNTELLNIISKWKFEKVLVSIKDETEPISIS